MSVLTLEGIVENGLIRLRDRVKLSEHAKVYVIIPDVEAAPKASVRSPHLAHPERAADFIKKMVRL